MNKGIQTRQAAGAASLVTDAHLSPYSYEGHFVKQDETEQKWL